MAWEGVKVPLWEGSVEVVVSTEVLGLAAKEALAMAVVLGQDLVVAMVVGLEVASVEALVVLLVALVEALVAGWEAKVFSLAHRAASGK